MPRAKKVPQAQIFGDATIHAHFLKSRCYVATAKHFNKGKNNVYPSRKQVKQAIERHLAGTSAEFWTNSHKKAGGRPPILDSIAKDNLKGMARQSQVRRDFIRPLQMECEDLIHKERKKMLVRLGFEVSEDLINMRDPRYQVSQQTLDNYVNEIWPKK